MLEKRLMKLDSVSQLGDTKQAEIEITNMANTMLLADYGLTNDSFEEKSSFSFGRCFACQTNMAKKLVKKQPNLTIENILNISKKVLEYLKRLC